MGILVVVVLVGLSVYFFWKPGQEHKKEVAKEKISDMEIGITEEKQEGMSVEEGPPRIIPPEAEPSAEPAPEEDPYRKIEDDLAEFFSYLDNQKYVRDLVSKPDTYGRFKRILKQVEARPPVPAGEGNHSERMMRNITHFFHIMEKVDILLIKEILSHEHDTLERDLKMFFEWLTLGDRYPDPERLRPSRVVLYQYAGFFLNTIGGRAYLFRRTPSLRLLVSYYCLLVLHESDRTGENSYGLDILPYIEPVRDEIANYPDFQFQTQYIEQLRAIEIYYLQKRIPMP